MSFDLSGPKHPDNRTLLAWTEGELPCWRALPVRRHVRSCWQCRAEVASVQAAISAVTVELNQMPEPTRLAVNKAYWRFRQTVRERYPDTAPPPAVALRRNFPRVAAAGALLATAALAWVVTLPVFRPETKPRPPAAAVIRSTARREFTPPDRGHPPQPHLPDLAPPPVHPSPVAIPTQQGGPSEDELTAAEVKAVASLHRSGLCRTAGIAVRRTGQRVEVFGIARSRTQQVEIEALLSGIAAPGVLTVTVREPDDIPQSAVLPDSTNAPAPEPAAGDNATPPILDWLRESLRGRTGVTERDLFNLMNSMALLAEKASAEAWTLRRLAEQFPDARTRRLRPGLQTVVFEMAQDHTIVLENDLTALSGKLALLSTGSPAALTPPGRDAREPWQTGALTLQHHVEELVRHLLASFSAHGAETHPRSITERTAACVSLANALRTGLQTTSAALR